jgi:Flp pilus assembly protein TadG
MKSAIKFHRRKRARRKGANLVEAALTLLPLLSMIWFIMDMGRILLTQQFVVERARVAARRASVNNWTSSQLANYFAYNSINAPSGGTTTPGLLGLLPSEITYTTLGASASPDYRLQVVVKDVPMTLLFPGMKGTYNAAPITATAPAQGMGATN